MRPSNSQEITVAILYAKAKKHRQHIQMKHSVLFMFEYYGNHSRFPNF